MGSTSEFALDLALIDDPDPVDFLEEDVRASWGTISIWAGGANLCSMNGRTWSEDGSHWYLLTLTEWFVDQWVPLLHEERLPLVNSSDDAARGAVRGARAAEIAAIVNDDYDSAESWQDWKFRHSLRSAEPEALLPDLYLRRFGDNLELSVGAAPLPGADTGATFPRIGTVRIPVVSAAVTIHRALSNLVGELLRRAPKSERLRAIRERLNALIASDPDDVAALGWLAGIGESVRFTEMWARVNSSLSEASRLHAQELSSNQRPAEMASLVMSTPFTVLYGSLAPDLSSEDVTALYESALTAPRDSQVRNELVKMNEEIRSNSTAVMSETSGEQGSVLGDLFYSMFVAPRGYNAPVAIDAFLTELGVSVQDIEIHDSSIRGLSILASDATVGIVVNESYRGNRTSAVRRFTLAHELAHLVLDQGFSRELIVASGPWAPVEIEKRANAFAAALLMPTAVMGRVRAELPDGIDSRDGVSALAKALGVSFSALVNRLQNLGLLSFNEAETYRDDRS